MIYLVLKGLGLGLGLFGGLIGYLRYKSSKKWGYYKLDKDLEGRVIVLTGASEGLGFETAKVLAGANAHLVWGCRNKEKAIQKKEEIKRMHPACRIDIFPLDLSSVASVRNFVSEVSAANDSIDALICNAGVWIPADGDGNTRRTADGFEAHFEVNYLANFIIVNGLIENVKKSDFGRVVNVNSMLMNQGALDLSAPETIYKIGRTPPMMRHVPTGYADSKLAAAILNRELAERYKNFPNLRFYATCPGFCKTELSREVNFPLLRKILLAPLFLAIMRGAARGACNIVHATTAEGLQNGGYYRECKLAEKENAKIEKMVIEDGDGTRLWQLSERCLEMLPAQL